MSASGAHRGRTDARGYSGLGLTTGEMAVDEGIVALDQRVRLGGSIKLAGHETEIASPSRTSAGPEQREDAGDVNDTRP